MIHLILGNTGSGKTTYSNKLKNLNNGIVFSIDTWNKTLFLDDKKQEDGLEWFLQRIERAESLIMDLVEQLENAKTDSILDLGFSKKEHRDKFRSFAKHNGFDLKLHFLDIDKITRWDRIQKRNIEKGSTYEFVVSTVDFEFMEEWFEKPSRDEMKQCIIVKK